MTRSGLQERTWDYEPHRVEFSTVTGSQHQPGAWCWLVHILLFLEQPVSLLSTQFPSSLPRPKFCTRTQPSNLDPTCEKAQ